MKQTIRCAYCERQFDCLVRRDVAHYCTARCRGKALYAANPARLGGLREKFPERTVNYPKGVD